MKYQEENLNDFDETKTMKVIQEMIEVSRTKIKSDGILFLVWGYAMSLTFIGSYLKSILLMPYWLNRLISFFDPALGLLALIFTVVFVIKQRKRVTTYIGQSIRYVWIALFISLMLINLILFNATQEVNFALQHPLFMVNIAFALIVTGIILKFKLIILGGLFFASMAYLCSSFTLQEQMIFDGIAWLVGFVVPGHWLYYTRKK